MCTTCFFLLEGIFFLHAEDYGYSVKTYVPNMKNNRVLFDGNLKKDVYKRQIVIIRTCVSQGSRLWYTLQYKAPRRT